jgi:hypothetical protein
VVPAGVSSKESSDAVLLDGNLGNGLDLLEFRYLGDHGRRFAALPSYLFHQRVEPGLAPGRDNHLGALSANWRAVSRPMPLEAPITAATCSSTGLSCIITLLLVRFDRLTRLLFASASRGSPFCDPAGAAGSNIESLQSVTD